MIQRISSSSFAAFRVLIEKLSSANVLPLQPSLAADPNRDAKEPELDAKLRFAKRFYRELKIFLAEHLDSLCSEDDENGGGGMAPLLQELWNRLLKAEGGGGDEDGGAWLTLSHLEYDVEAKALAYLEQAKVVEFKEDATDVLRMIDFSKK